MKKKDLTKFIVTQEILGAFPMTLDTRASHAALGTALAGTG
jgi:hypothetical protein